MTINDSPVITLRLLRQLKSGGSRFKAGDSSGVDLTAQNLLVRTLALRNYLRRVVLAADEKHVGVFLPPTVPGVATNLALALDDRVAVNLNYTVTSSVLQKCSQAAGLKHIITSRKFIEKVNLDPGCEMVFLEDIREKISLGDKLSAALNARFRSADGLHKWLGLTDKKHSDPLTIIFTSGSTGVPKGVVLTSGNITSNVLGIEEVVRLDEHDVVLGILPFFHSFGYTVTIWAAMCLPCGAAYHFSPLEARPIGKLAEKFKATVLLATPTFLRSYMRRIPPEQFSHLEVVVVGAEKMPLGLFAEFEEKFGVRPVEGYGATELSPVVSVNVPACRASGPAEVGLREGSVGKPFRDVQCRVVDPDTDEPLDGDTAGLLEICGPNVMQGYYGQDELTRAAMHDNWYRTGDMARVDQDGFIHITGRRSRFSKIGGEMVPHIQIEEHLLELAGTDDEGTLRVAVTSVPDAKRGERLIVLRTPDSPSPDAMIEHITESGLPNLYLPSRDSFLEVEAIPILGSGKLDLAGLQHVAKEAFCPDTQ